jgi:cytochrome c-type biogenesis protein CcmH/NrfF
MPASLLWGRRLACTLIVLVAASLIMGLADNSVRYNDLGSKIMCTCGCGQTLTTCNHLGCSALATESGELKQDLARGDSDNAILIAFQNEYGPTVLAAPMLTKFNMIAWVMPPLLLLLGIAGTVVLVRRWRLRAAARPAEQRTAQFQMMRERVRKETEL